MHFVRQALELLRPAEINAIPALLGLSAFAAVAQTVAILAIMPFVILLSNPAAIDLNPILARIHDIFGPDTPNQLLVHLGAIGIGALAVGNLAVAFENWLIQRYLSRLGHRLESDLLRTMLSQPYEYFAEYHSGRLSNVVLDQAGRVIDGVIGAFFAVVSNVVLTILIVAMLLIVSFESTLITLLALLVLYLGVFLVLKRRIAAHGAELTELSGSVYSAVKETLEGIREVKMNCAERFFVDRFASINLSLARLSVRSGVLAFLPNFVLETIVFAGLVALGLFFVMTNDQSGMSISYIALYGMATYRLVPALNGVFEGLSEIQHDGDAVRLVRNHLHERGPKKPSASASVALAIGDIRVEGVCYRYPGSDTEQLTGINLKIPAGSSVCLFGESGAGKSTLLNILAGLIRPTDGDVICENASLSKITLVSWRKHVGFCPQQIFLFDDSIASNIAFGIDEQAIDVDRVEQVGKLVNLDSVVVGRSRGYLSTVGEGGTELSGGQRQRVGIARALYNDAAIIVLDEALVGLDDANQSAILDSLFGLPGKTLIIATHDTAVAKRCDQIVLLHEGRLQATGTFEEVLSD